MNDFVYQLLSSGGSSPVLIIMVGFFVKRWIAAVDDKVDDLIDANNKLSAATEVYKESLRHVERRLENLEYSKPKL